MTCVSAVPPSGAANHHPPIVPVFADTGEFLGLGNAIAVDTSLILEPMRVSIYCVNTGLLDARYWVNPTPTRQYHVHELSEDDSPRVARPEFRIPIGQVTDGPILLPLILPEL